MGRQVDGCCEINDGSYRKIECLLCFVYTCNSLSLKSAIYNELVFSFPTRCGRREWIYSTGSSCYKWEAEGCEVPHH